jgi:hypothetical protein
LAPLTSGLAQRNPKILLGGTHQPALLRYLDGWPRRRNQPLNFMVQFAADGSALASFADDQFDFAVIQAPSAANLDQVVRELTRVARQGLITRR